MFMRYVLGFLFDQSLKNVVLINKLRPKWQYGKKNGVGGKINENEMPNDAMIREFFEETGLIINNWKEIATIGNDSSIIYVYGAINENINNVQSTTDEIVEIVNVDTIGYDYESISNTPWLVRMTQAMLVKKDSSKKFEIKEIEKIKV